MKLICVRKLVRSCCAIRGDPPDNGTSRVELPVDALGGGLSSSWLVNRTVSRSSLKLREPLDFQYLDFNVTASQESVPSGAFPPLAMQNQGNSYPLQLYGVFSHKPSTLPSESLK